MVTIFNTYLKGFTKKVIKYLMVLPSIGMRLLNMELKRQLHMKRVPRKTTNKIISTITQCSTLAVVR